MKYVGFDCTEGHRTFAGTSVGGSEICPSVGVPRFSERYEVRYPLREWGWDRDRCGRVIASAGLPIPPKSACFFCPAMKKLEIERMRVEEPDLYALAVHMERTYRQGRHFKGDEFMTIKARHRVTKEEMELETMAASKAAAREWFRQRVGDSSPYQWEIRVNPAVRGLGRNFTWEEVGGVRIANE